MSVSSNVNKSSLLTVNESQIGLNLNAIAEQPSPLHDSFTAMRLSPLDIDKIMDLEQSTWVPGLQASKETILSRLQLNHFIAAVSFRSELAGMIGWCYSTFSINESISNFPATFIDFSSRPSAEKSIARSAFIYNVGVKPSMRKQGVGRILLSFAFEKMVQDGISQAFLDSRMPSYSGSILPGNELVTRNKQFKSAVDDYFVSNKMPFKQILMLDQTVRFYLTNGFEPWFIVKDFIKDDSSGNNRLICHKSF